MKLPRPRPSDADLQSWLRTGSPARIDKMLGDATIAERLERLTELRPEERASLDVAVAPSTGFRERTETAVHRRVTDLDRTRAIFELLGLGAHTARALMTAEHHDDGH